MRVAAVHHPYLAPYHGNKLCRLLAVARATSRRIRDFAPRWVPALKRHSHGRSARPRPAPPPKRVSDPTFQSQRGTSTELRSARPLHRRSALLPTSLVGVSGGGSHHSFVLSSKVPIPHLAGRCVRGLKRARNRPPLPWRWREHGSERPDSPDNHEAVLKTPAGSAELPHTANGAGHTASRDASNRPQHARIAGVARGEARRAATGRGSGLRAEPHATPFFPSRALGPMLSPSARELWPLFPRFRAIPRSQWRR